MTPTVDLGGGRATSYLRALLGGLRALAPNDDHVPLAECEAHITALDPELSGDLLRPAEVTSTGMPAFPWMERARAERAASKTTIDSSDEEIERASSLNDTLGRRLRDRRALHQHLRAAALLPLTRLNGAVRKIGPPHDAALVYDRQSPDGRWVRLRFEARFRGGDGGMRLNHGRLEIDTALEHLLTRHFATGLPALQAHLRDALQAEVASLSRAWIGPFWFPGLPLPAGVPAELGRGLVLHASREVLAPQLPDVVDRDPMVAADAGPRVLRDRRLAVSPPVERAARDWFAGHGVVGDVVVVGAPRAKRL